MRDALIRVQLLASEDAERAATTLSTVIHEYVDGSATSSDLNDAREAFRVAARADFAGQPE